MGRGTNIQTIGSAVFLFFPLLFGSPTLPSSIPLDVPSPLPHLTHIHNNKLACSSPYFPLWSYNHVRTFIVWGRETRALTCLCRSHGHFLFYNQIGDRQLNVLRDKSSLDSSSMPSLWTMPSIIRVLLPLSSFANQPTDLSVAIWPCVWRPFPSSSFNTNSRLSQVTGSHSPWPMGVDRDGGSRRTLGPESPIHTETLWLGDQFTHHPNWRLWVEKETQLIFH